MALNMQMNKTDLRSEKAIPRRCYHLTGQLHDVEDSHVKRGCKRSLRDRAPMLWEGGQ
ncbi:hypothetical protein J6590_087021 [Homalodisca vitripennis]|nr:hypothetical protein J6590_087021 [Homalodisca vitripennis]